MPGGNWMYRALLIGPVACAVIGGAAGVCLAMLYRQEPNERAHVYLDDSLPLLAGGAVLGCLAGLCIFAACRRWPWVRSGLTVLVMTVFGGRHRGPIRVDSRRHGEGADAARGDGRRGGD